MYICEKNGQLPVKAEHEQNPPPPHQETPAAET